MSADVGIVAMSARTPVGLTAESAAAAVRCRISRQGKHPYFVGPTGEGIRSAIDARLHLDAQGVTRLTGLAGYALKQLANRLPDAAWRDGLRVAVLLATPEHRPGFGPREEAELLRNLERQAPLPVEIRVAERGHAGALHALGLAVERIKAGKSDLCLVGGVDSYFHADTVDWLVAQGQIGERSPFAPGEGSCFLALASRALREDTRLAALALVRATHSAKETSLIRTDDVNLARGLTTAIAQAAAGLRLPDEAVDDIWCDLNGERYRTDEWSYALLRLSHVFRQEHGKPTTYTTAADSWGDMGAASGALLSMLAVRSWQRSYASGPRALVFAGSERGLRAIAILEQAGRPA